MFSTIAARRATVWLPLIIVFAAGCRDNAITNPATVTSQELPAAEQRSIAPPSTGNLMSSAPVLATCGPVSRYTLTDMRSSIGTVTVTNDARNVYVTYAVTADDWYISDTRLAVARTRGAVPQDKKKSPMPWSFPNATTHQPVVTSFTYVVSLASVNATAGDDLIVAAMAGVVHPKNKKNRSGKWDWTVMWALRTGAAPESGDDRDSDRDSDRGDAVRALHKYRVASCTDAPPPPPPAVTGGVVTITFDDGYLTTFTNAFPVLRSLQLKGNVAVNPEPIDGLYSDYMTMANLRSLRDAGWSIVSHSYTHPDLTTLTPDSLDKELRNSQSWVSANGFGPTNVFIVPFHSWGARERAAVGTYYKYARGYTVNQFNPALYQKWPTTNPLDLSGYEPEFAPYKTAAGRAATMAVIERAVREGEFVDIFFHRIPSADVPEFTLLMTEIARYRANVRSWGEAVRL